jgi:hypothetical protein
MAFRNMGNTSSSGVSLLLSSGMSWFFLLLGYSWHTMLCMRTYEQNAAHFSQIILNKYMLPILVNNYS